MLDARWAVFAVLLISGAGCDPQHPDLGGPYSCGPKTCSSGQICVTESAGSQCDVNLDAGIGPYQTFAWTCMDLPAACDGVPSCSCVPGQGTCFDVSGGGRQLDYGCI